ncbi:hypothetical protein P9112_000873 [Eukaryota sp. TZLM1-RC]
MDRSTIHVLSAILFIEQRYINILRTHFHQWYSSFRLRCYFRSWKYHTRTTQQSNKSLSSTSHLSCCLLRDFFMKWRFVRGVKTLEKRFVPQVMADIAYNALKQWRFSTIICLIEQEEIRRLFDKWKTVVLFKRVLHCIQTEFRFELYTKELSNHFTNWKISFKSSKMNRRFLSRNFIWWKLAFFENIKNANRIKRTYFYRWKIRLLELSTFELLVLFNSA